MDFFYRSLILFFLFSGFAQALPTVGVTSVRGATSTVYSVSASGGTSPLLTAPVGSTVINSGITSNAAGYTTNVLLSSSVKSAAVNWGVSAAALALSATKFASGPYGGLAILAGTALYNYYSSAGLKPMSGGVGSSPSVSIPGQHTYTLTGSTDQAAACLASGTVSGLCSAFLCVAGPNSPGECQQLRTTDRALWSTYYVSYSSATTCPANYTLTGVTCFYNGTPPITAVTDSQIQTALTASPPADKGAVLAQMHTPATDAQFQNGNLVDPVSDAPTITAPASTTDAPKTTVNPDNSVSKATDTTSCTQTSTTSITCSTSTVTINTYVTGAPVTTTTVNAPPDTPPTTQQTTQKTDCEKFPMHIGCSDYGTPAPQEIIPVESIPLSNAYTSWGSGSCPAAVSLPHGMTFKYDSMCSALVLLKPILIAMGLLISMFIVSGGVKE